MPIWLQMARSYNNPDSVNYKIAYLREQMSKNLGYLSFEEQAQLAMLGKTITIGGYLNTELIKAKSIYAEMLNVDDLAAITGKFSGNVYVGGDLLVGGQGVLSVLKFESAQNPQWGDFQGWGFVGAGTFLPFEKVNRVAVYVSIPQNFNISKAILNLYAMPIFWEDDTLTPVTPTGWKQSKSLKLYVGDGLEGRGFMVGGSDVMGIDWHGETDITSAVWGTSSYSPTLAYSGSDPSNTQNMTQIKAGDIINYLAPGANKVFYVETTATQDASNMGFAKLIAVIEGYAKPS